MIAEGSNTNVLNGKMYNQGVRIHKASSVGKAHTSLQENKDLRKIEMLKIKRKGKRILTSDQKDESLQPRADHLQRYQKKNNTKPY